jgi:hypothetical protein
MMNEKNSTQKVIPERVQSAKEKLSRLKEEIDLDKPARIEAQLDALATDLLGSGLSEPMSGAPSLTEVLVNIKSKLQVPQEGLYILDAIDAAERLAYLIEDHWYGEEAEEGDQQEAKRLATVLYDKLIPILDAHAGR